MDSLRNNVGDIMNRRRFLARTGTMMSAGVLARAVRFPLVSMECAASQGDAELTDWDSVRAQFNLDPNKINMACLWHASHPKPVREAIERHRRGLDECPYEYFQANAPHLEADVRAVAADYLKASPDEFAMTGSTTEGLATIYAGLKLRTDQEILSTEQDHIVTKRSLTYRAERAGTPIRTISLYDRSDTVSEEQVIGAIHQVLTPRTRVVAVTWVHSSTGVKIPVSRIAQSLAGVNVNRAEG